MEDSTRDEANVHEADSEHDQRDERVRGREGEGGPGVVRFSNRGCAGSRGEEEDGVENRGVVDEKRGQPAANDVAHRR